MKRVLVIPHILVQHANALSSPYTIGFPAMTAWLGFSHALERQMKKNQEFGDLCFLSTGVVSHHFELKAYKDENMYFHSLVGMSFPLTKNGDRASFIEGARCDLDVTVVIEVEHIDLTLREELEKWVWYTVQSKLRVAGGDILKVGKPRLVSISDDATLKSFRRSLGPGFVLIERRSLLRDSMEKGTEGINALLEYLRVYHRCTEDEPCCWESHRKTLGWIVPIATGFHRISEEIPSQYQRDQTVKHYFAESIVTLGEFIMTYRVDKIERMLWKYTFDEACALYRCVNEIEKN